ncbi:hypothetical protein [Comamonas squillarum]|uniref:Phage protein n=1 Tax=Comamonas squillarum TaxID=2977320 RepID=A0ABY5ZYS1_9BURK|nr:hypothetical protein [Comamonas sp. PR12]UXC19148.1 hypothetical protein N4T19_03205 [Comamonas sp. PR12]
MNMLLLKLMKRLNEAGESGSDAGGTGAAPAPAPAEDRGDVVDPELNASTLASLVGQDAGGEGAEAGEAGGEGGEGAGEGQEAEGAGEGGQGGRSAGIPPARFNEVNERRKQAEKDLAEAQAEIERLRQGGSQAPSPAPAPAAGAPAAPAAAPAAPFDEDAQEQAYVSALIDGDHKRAAEIRKGINAHLRDEATKAAIQRADEQRQAEHQQAVSRALAAETALTIEKYPYLDTAEGAEAVELIVAARDAKIAKGMPAHEALRVAVAAIAPRFAPVAAAAPTPGKDSASAAAPADSRTSAAIARGAAASVAQPPALNGGVGDRANAGRINVAQMTDEQFENLSPAEIKKLRGD